MKKSFVIAVLGLIASEASSFAQGSMSFNSYTANSSVGIPVYFSTEFGSGGLVGAGYTADLLWSLTPKNEVAGTGSLAPGWESSGSGAPSLQSVATPFGTTPATLGYFQSPHNFVLNPYTPGTTVYFEVIFYQTVAGSYAASISRGHSATFSTTLATGTQLPTEINFPSFFGVPEPSTLVLAGLGGLVSLVALCYSQRATKQQT